MPPDGAPLRPADVVLLLLGGAAIAAAILIPFSRSTRDSRTFVETPEFLVWFVLIAAQTALWAVSCAVFIAANRRLGRRFPTVTRVAWLADGAFLGALLLPPVFTLLSRSNALN